MCPTLFLCGKMGRTLCLEDHTRFSIVLFGRCNLLWRIPEICIVCQQIASVIEGAEICMGRVTAFPSDIMLRQLGCRRSSLHQG